MFPPQKSKPKPSGSPRSGPPGGASPSPPMPPGADPFGPAPAGGPAVPPTTDPFGSSAIPPMPGVRPGQGMDPIAAMLGGLGGAGPPAAGGPQGPPMGPDGFPIGGSLPPPDPSGGDEMGGSSLLQALAGAMGGDQYTQPPGAPDTMFQGIGQGDPNMGIEQLLSMLALGQMGVGGGPSPASSGVADLGPQSLIGQMVGLGR